MLVWVFLFVAIALSWLVLVMLASFWLLLQNLHTTSAETLSRGARACV
jgi:hypothetical protein